MLELIGTLTSIFTSVIALAVSVVVFRSEKKLTVNSVRPLLNAFCGSHKDNVYVRIGNYGMGPAIVSDVKFETCDGRNIDTDSLAHYVYDKAKADGKDIGPFYDYIPVSALIGRAVAPDGELFLVQYRSHDPELCDYVKRALADIAIVIRYKDIFENLQDHVCRRDCSWLGCNTCEDDGPDLHHEFS